MLFPRVNGRDVAVLALGLLLGAGVLWVSNDYSIVRARAQNGQAAYEYIVKNIQQQQAAQGQQPGSGGVK